MAVLSACAVLIASPKVLRATVANVYMNGRNGDVRLLEGGGVSDCVSLLGGGSCE